MTQSIRSFFSGLSRVAFFTGILLLSAVLAAPSSVAQDVPVITEDQVNSNLEAGDELTVPITVRNLNQAADVNAVDVTLDYGNIPADFVEFETSGTLLDGFLTDQSDDEANAQATLSGASNDALGGGDDSGVLARVVLEVTGEGGGTATFPDVRFNDVNPPEANLDQASFEVITSNNVVKIENATAKVGNPSTVDVTATDLSGLGITNFDIEIEVEDPVELDSDNPVNVLADLDGSNASYDPSTDLLTISGISQDGLSGNGPLFELNTNSVGSEVTAPISFLGGTEFRDSNGNEENVALSDGELQVLQNGAPTANDDPFSTGEESTLEVTDSANGVLANDTDPDGDALSVSAVEGGSGDVGSQITLGSGASLTLDGDGTFAYTPPSEADTLEAGETTDDSFQYTVADEFGGTDQGTATITLQGENDAPTISGLGDDDPTTIDEDNTADPIEFTVDDAEGDLSTLSVTGSSGDPDLVQTIDVTGPDAQGAASLTVTPRPDSNGTTDITVEVSDGAASASGTFTLEVDPVNDAPTISGLPEADTIDEDESAGPIGFAVSDVESDSSAIALSGGSGNTDLVLDDGVEIGENGVTVTPRPDSNGTADITITAEDPDDASTDETFTLEVEPVNDPPVAVNDTFSVDENDELARGAPNGLLANDFHPDGEDFQASPFAVSGPENGEVNIGSDGSFQYTPAEGFAGTDQFAYQISDGVLADTATVTVNVEAIEVTISGSVSYPGEGDTGLTDGRPLSGVPVQVSAVSGSESAMDTTGADGTFSVSVGTGEYVVQAQPDRDVPDEIKINATDAIRTIGAYLGTSPFVDDLQAEVADVNESGGANATDALKMALFFLDEVSAFEAGDWASTADTADVTGGGNASVSVFTAAYGDADLSGGEQDGGSSAAAATANSTSSSADSEEKSDLRGVEMGKTFEVPVRLNSAATLGSYSLKIDFPADKVEFEGVADTDRNVMSMAQEGTVRLSWFDQSGEQPMKLGSGAPLVTLRFSAAEGVKKGTAVTPEVTTGELAGPDAQPLTSAKVSVAGVEVGSIPDEFALNGSYPNPVSGQATVEVDLPNRATVTVEVYNTLGQRVQTIEKSMSAGKGQTLQVDGSRLASGQYFYRVKADLGDSTAEETGRITVVR